MAAWSLVVAILLAMAAEDDADGHFGERHPLPELVDQVRKHASRSLVQQYIYIYDGYLGVIKQVFVFWQYFFFKFKEVNNETAWVDYHNIITFRYTEPMTWWMRSPILRTTSIW